MAAVATSSLLIKNTKKSLTGGWRVCYFRGDMNSNNTKRSKGRPAGSNSFVRIRACDLIKMIGEMAVIPVSKVWLRENGVEASEPQITFITPQASPPEPIEEKIQFSITQFED